MENKAHTLAAGAFVLGLVAALVALVVWLTSDSTVRNIYELTTRDPVSGLQPQATVRYRGVAVGKVTAIDFDPEIKGNVRVRITVDERVPLTTSTYATLSYQGVTGIAAVALDDAGESQTALVPNNRNPPRIPLKPSLFSQLQDRGQAIIVQFEEVMKRVNTLLDKDNQTRIAEALGGIAQAASSASRLARSLDDTTRTRLNPTLAALPPLMARANGTLDAVKGAAGDVSRVANGLNGTVTRLSARDGPIDHLADSAQSVRQAVGSFSNTTLPRVNRMADDTARAVRRLGRAADTLNDNPQSLLFGSGSAPGPGEPGFVAPAAK
jgi:phospholipid/cholesterol/gamma-HCH transport system substrate-binding protein